MKYYSVLIFLVLLFVACSKEDDIEQIEIYPLPSDINPEVAARLTERYETDTYIFYYAPGDTVEFERCEAYASWVMNYLKVSLPKKIEYFKFKDWYEMGDALPFPAGGWAFPKEVAYATLWKWHNHECMHVVAHWWANENIPPLFFVEGMAVAHEFDPFNNDWVSRWNRADIREPWISIVKRLKSEGKLYPISTILDSQSFLDSIGNEEERIGYPQAGMFVQYLIEEYGLDKMQEIYMTLDYSAFTVTIEAQFETVFGLNVEQAEQNWLEWLDK